MVSATCADKSIFYQNRSLGMILETALSLTPPFAIDFRTLLISPSHCFTGIHFPLCLPSSSRLLAISLQGCKLRDGSPAPTLFSMLLEWPLQNVSTLLSAVNSSVASRCSQDDVQGLGLCGTGTAHLGSHSTPLFPSRSYQHHLPVAGTHPLSSLHAGSAQADPSSTQGSFPPQSLSQVSPIHPSPHTFSPPGSGYHEECHINWELHSPLSDKEPPKSWLKQDKLGAPGCGKRSFSLMKQAAQRWAVKAPCTESCSSGLPKRCWGSSHHNTHPN